ncbi:MAG: GNAT family N-acetyltransferase [Firmicutes bacterium]|nr:GNAT family N-acetyltransferase [Bacillota bacterium]
MDFEIRKMEMRDRNEVLCMMRVFYRSPALITNGSEQIFERDFEACVGDERYADGFVFEAASGEIIGYAMTARGFSTEFGKPCVWIEDLYVKEPYRGQGTGSAFFDFIRERYAGCIFRLEAERENTGAVRLYQKNGFCELPYLEMIKV